MELRILIALAAVVAAPMAGASDNGWQPWVVDEEGDAITGEFSSLPNPSPAADVLTVDAYLSGDFLHIRFQTAAMPAFGVPGTVDPFYMSNVYFVLYGEGAGGTSITLRGTQDGFEATQGGQSIPSTDWGIEADGQPWEYEAWIRVPGLLPQWDNGWVRIQDPDVYTFSGLMGTMDEATGPPLGFGPGSVGDGAGTASALLDTWSELEGPDMAGGTAVAVDNAGRVHVSYYVYDDSRGDPVGLYHARPADGLWQAERVGSFSPLDESRDGTTRTEIVTDDAGAHILYNRCPGQGCADPWHYVPPARIAALSTEAVPLAAEPAGGVADAAAIATGAGRLVVAVPSSDGALHILERDADGWDGLGRIADARLPRIAVSDSDVHVAFVRESPRDARGVLSDLYYTAASRDWDELRIATDLDDYSRFWNIETDGGYDMALHPDGRPAFAWSRSDHRDQDLPELGYGILDGDRLLAEAAPLKPVHGNPQPAVRLAFDGQGAAHVGSGYGGTDRYAVRLPDGAWRGMDIDRHDVWDLAVTPDGIPVFAYTQPHGGTTVAISALQGGVGAADTETRVDPSGSIVRLTPVGAWIPMAALAAALFAGRRGSGAKTDSDDDALIAPFA